jgi:hypothetical protein
MNVTLGAALSGLLMAGDQGGDDLVLRHDVDARYNRTAYEAACRSTVFQARFRNGPEERGRVDHVLIDGRPVAGAAEMLDIRAARRLITSIEILNCGTEPRRPVFQGMINFEPMESRSLGMRWSLAFRLIRESRDSWRMTID